MPFVAKSWRRRGIGAAILLEMALLPTGFVWREWRQRSLNQDLVTAIEQQNTRDVIALLQRGADPDFAYDEFTNVSLRRRLERLWNRDSEQLTSALAVALERGNTKSALALLDHGARPNGPKNVINYTPYLVTAAERSRVEISLIQSMIAHGAEVSDTDYYGKSALIAAAGNNRMDLVTLLLDHGANPNAIIGHNGPVTLLIEAVKYHNAPMVRRLLQSGAKVNLPYQGMPSLLVLAKGDAPLACLLKQAGAK